MDFRLWLETQDSESIKLSILGSLPDELKGDHRDEERLMSMRTSTFGKDILDKVRNLGIIQGLKDSDPQRYQDVISAIGSGITISDLIEKVAGKDGLGNLKNPGKQPSLMTDPKALPYAMSFQ